MGMSAGDGSRSPMCLFFAMSRIHGALDTLVWCLHRCDVDMSALEGSVSAFFQFRGITNWVRQRGKI